MPDVGGRFRRAPCTMIISPSLYYAVICPRNIVVACRTRQSSAVRREMRTLGASCCVFAIPGPQPQDNRTALVWHDSFSGLCLVHLRAPLCSAFGTLCVPNGVGTCFCGWLCHFVTLVLNSNANPSHSIYRNCTHLCVHGSNPPLSRC